MVLHFIIVFSCLPFHITIFIPTYSYRYTELYIVIRCSSSFYFYRFANTNIYANVLSVFYLFRSFFHHQPHPTPPYIQRNELIFTN